MNKEEIALKFKDVLKEIPLPDLNLLASFTEFQEFDDKEVILGIGNNRRKAFLILEGAARGFVINARGEEKNLMIRGKGIFVADAESLFRSVPQKLEIVAIGHTEVLMFSFDEFEKLAHENKMIMSIYLSALKEVIVRLRYRVDTFVLLSPEERYIDLLKENPVFLKSSFDKYIANFLGISPISLSRIKKRLSERSVNKS